MPYKSRDELEKVKKGSEFSLFNKRGSTNPRSNRTKSTAEPTKSKRAPTEDRKTLSELLPKGEGNKNPRGRPSEKAKEAAAKKKKEEAKKKRQEKAAAEREKARADQKKRFEKYRKRDEEAKKTDTKKTNGKKPDKVKVTVKTNVSDAVKDAASTLKKDKPKKKRKKVFGKFRPFGGKIAKALLGEDEAFGGDKGAIDFVRPKKKNMGGMMKAKGSAKGGMMGGKMPRGMMKGGAVGGKNKKPKGYSRGGAVKRRGVGIAKRGFGKAMK